MGKSPTDGKSSSKGATCEWSGFVSKRWAKHQTSQIRRCEAGGPTQERVEMFHENDKVNITEAKGEKTQAKRGEVPLTGTRLRTEHEDNMQWEKGKESMLAIKLEVKEKKHTASGKHRA